jgi:hypothetical protein
MGDPRMIIAIDPGGTTGIAVWVASMDAWTRHEIGPCSEDVTLKGVLTYLSGVVTLVEPFGPDSENCIHMIVEPFEFRQDDRSRDKIDYIAGEVIGALRVWACERSFVKRIRQSASYGVEGFWTDDRVKKAGLWVPAKRHAMDATKHVLQYRTFRLNHLTLLDPFKPL